MIDSNAAIRINTRVTSVLIIMIVVLMTPRVLDMISGFGFRIPQDDMATDYAKGVFWSVVLGFGIFLWPVGAADRKCLLWGWLGKSVVTLGLMLLYECKYGLDAYMYFDESNHRDFSLAAFSITGDDAGTQNIINLAALNNFLLPNSYHAQKVTFAMIGLAGVYLFYRSAVTFFRTGNRNIFYLIAFFPGILFWSSILGKEPVVFLAIALYVFGTISWHVHGRYRYLIPVAAGIFLALMVRVWLGPIMVMPLLLLFLRSSRNVALKIFLVLLTCVLLAVSAKPMLQRFEIAALEDVLGAADKTTQGFVNTAGGSTQDLAVDLTSPTGALKFLPKAAFTALFRPLPGEVMNPFGLLAGMESAILVFLLFRAIRRTRLRELNEPLVLWSVSFILIWALINGIVSSANFGVAVRYKLQILPVLLGVLVYLSRKRDGGRMPSS